MKIYFLVILVFSFGLKANSQNSEFFKEIKKLNLENDSLKKEIANLYNDSIINLKNSIRKNDESIDRLQKERIQIDLELKNGVSLARHFHKELVL